MNVWLIQPAEPMPFETGGNRLWRTGVTAKLLSEAGHTVTWWASNFSHAQKQFRKLDGGVVQVASNYTIRFLPALGYQRNLSLARIRDHRHVARQLRMAMEGESAPDVIVASFPTIESCVEAVEFGRRHSVPVVVDVRDQWPDLFYDSVPRAIRPLVRLACLGISRQADHVFRHATAVTGNAVQAMEWGLARGRRKRSDLDAAFPMGFFPPVHAEADVRSARDYWNQRLPEDAFVVAYGGAIGHTGDFDTIVQTARALGRQGSRIYFVLAGVGDELDRLRAVAQSVPNVHLAGWLAAPEMAELLARSSVGLVPYKDRANFEGGITNKPVEYLHAGLPVVTTLRRGELREILEASRCGAFYDAGDVQGLADRLVALERDPEGRQVMSDRARGLFEGRFRAEKVYGAMIEHISRIVEAYGAGRRT